MDYRETSAGPNSLGLPSLELLCLSLRKTDRICVTNASAALINVLRTLIQANWQRGIQGEASFTVSHEFKLKGNPWCSTGEESITSHNLVATIFCFLLQHGWVLKHTIVVNKQFKNKDVFYFKQATLPDATVRMCVVSFHESDKIRVLGGPPEVAQVVRSTIQYLWHRGLQRERFYCGVPEYKMLGNPWTANWKETIQAQIFVGHLIKALDSAGWEVYESVGITNRNPESGFGDIDSWFLRCKSHLPSAPKFVASFV